MRFRPIRRNPVPGSSHSPGRALFYGNLALDTYDWDPLTETFIAV